MIPFVASAFSIPFAAALYDLPPCLNAPPKKCSNFAIVDVIAWNGFIRLDQSTKKAFLPLLCRFLWKERRLLLGEEGGGAGRAAIEGGAGREV